MTQNQSTDQTIAVFKVINVNAARPLIVLISYFYKQVDLGVNGLIGLVFRQLMCRWRFVVLLSFIFNMGGCETISFYRQLAVGQVEILRDRQPVEELLRDSSVDEDLREQLQKIAGILSYAESRVGLVSSGSYSTYVDLKRDYVLWNVYAAKTYSVESVDQCYPLVGCLPYRGYFSLQKALDHASGLSADGLEIYIGGVPAYSTLGWFKDPILSSFVNWGDQELASLIIHELLHQNIWLKGEGQFNESLANFVGNQASLDWAQEYGEEKKNGQFIERRKQWQLFREFVVLAKGYLRAQFSSSQDFHELKLIKLNAMRKVRDCYVELSREVLDGRYEDFVFGERFNNAFIASVGVYEGYRSAFKKLFVLSDDDWAVFFGRVQELIALDRKSRQIKLESLSDNKVTSHADYDYTRQIHCEAF